MINLIQNILELRSNFPFQHISQKGYLEDWLVIQYGEVGEELFSTKVLPPHLLGMLGKGLIHHLLYATASHPLLLLEAKKDEAPAHEL